MLVVDASLAAVWYFPDERSELADSVLRVLPERGGIVPRLFWFEVRNLILTGERRGRTSPLETATFLRRLEYLPIEEDHSPDSATLLTLARLHGLTAYDAAYLELALRRALPLATLDRRLASAAGQAGVAPVDRV